MLSWYLWIVNRFFQNTSLKCEGQSGLNFIVNIVIRTGEPSKWRLGIWKLRQSQGLSWNSFVALIGPDWWSNVLLVVFHSTFKSLETIDNKYYSKSLAVALVTQINLASETYICYWVIWLLHLVFPLLRKSISRVWGRLTTRLPRRRWFYNLLRAASDQNIKVHLHNGMYGAVQ